MLKPEDWGSGGSHALYAIVHIHLCQNALQYN